MAQVANNSKESIGFCGSVGTIKPNLYAEEVNLMKLANVNTPLFQPCCRITLNVRFHIIRNTNGTGGQPVSVVTTMMNNLNAAYNPMQIYFTSLGNDFIDNDTYSTGWSSIALDPKFNPLIQLNVNTNAINVYVLPDNQWNQGRAANIPSRAFVIGGKQQGVTLALTNVASHEMGHCLGLYHTFGCTPTCYELPNGTNSATCGDLVVDTPADPGITFGSTTNSNDFNGCNWKGTVSLSPNCIAPGLAASNYSPLTNNIMSYAPIFNCTSVFTIGQGNRARMELLNPASILSTVRIVTPVSINANTVYINNNLVTSATSVPTNFGSLLSVANSEPNLIKTYTYQNTVLSGNMNTVLGPNNNICFLNVTGSSGSNSLAINISSACGNAQRSIVTFISSTFKVSPNPSSNEIVVAFSNVFLKEALPSYITIVGETDKKTYYEVNVKTLFDKGTFSATDQLKIDCANWPRGIYYLSGFTDESKTNKSQATIRLLIQ